MATAGAEIQVENGNYSRIHNAILEQLAITDFTGRELRCLLYLLRMTYGFQRKEFAISLNDWSAGTSISRSNIPDVLRRLEDRNVIAKSDNGKRKPPTWAFNKYFEEWDSAKPIGNGFGGIHVDTMQNSTGSITMDTKSGIDVDTSGGIDVDTKSGIPLQTTTTPIKDNRKKERKKEKNTSPVSADVGKTKEPTEHQKMFEAFCITIGWDYKLLTKNQRGQVAQNVGKLEAEGYNIDHLRQLWQWWKNDWRGKNGQRPTINQLMAEIGRFKVGELETDEFDTSGITYLRMKDYTYA